MFGFFRRLFRRTPSPLDRRFMNEDWRVGDLAECIVGDWDPGSPHDPRLGERLRVSGLRDGVSATGYCRAYFLLFEGKPQNYSWINLGFRKLRPSIEPASEEFRRELKDRLKTRQPETTNYRPRLLSQCPTHASGPEADPPEGASDVRDSRAIRGNVANGSEWRDPFLTGRGS